MAWRFEPTEEGQDIVVDGFEKGIADSPYLGIADMRNGNIISVPGEFSVGYETTPAYQVPIASIAYSVVAATDTFTWAGDTQLIVGTAIVITVSTGSGGVTSGHTYWVKTVPSNTTFTVSASVTPGDGTVGSTLNVTSNGTGTFVTVNMGYMTQIVSPNSSAQSSTGVVVDITNYGVDNNGYGWTFVASIPNWVYMGNTSSLAQPRLCGISLWSGFIFILKESQIDYISVSAATAAWVYDWKAINTVSTHRTFVDIDYVLYWCDQNWIGSLRTVDPDVPFDPTDPTTYTFNATALALPLAETSQCLEQLNDKLLVGAATNIVYQWDKFSNQYSAIYIAENGVARMVTVNTNTYIFAGNRGRIYLTNGSQAQLFKKVPDHLAGPSELEPYFHWGDAVFSRNQLYFSVAASSSANGAAISEYGALWAIDTDTKALRVVNRMSYGDYSGILSAIGITAGAQAIENVTYQTYGLVMTWLDGSGNFGSDYMPPDAEPYHEQETYVDSDLMAVGTYLKPHTYAQIEYKLSTPLNDSNGLQYVYLYYRQNLADSFTLIDNGNSTDNPGISTVFPLNFEKSQYLQIRAVLSSTTDSPSYVRLTELRMHDVAQ